MIFQLGLQTYSSAIEENTQVNSQYFMTQSEYVTQSDFELVGGLIFVEAELNGKKEKFILDTGAPHFLLNERDSNQKRRKSNLWMNGVGGNKKMAKVRGVKFDWQGITARNNVKYAVDLENIAKAKKRDFAGLIGYDQVRNKEVVLDYEKQKVFLLSRKNKDFFKNYNQVDKIWFRIIGHLPVVKVKIGKKKFYFGIDTGAEVNVIEKRLLKKIPKELIKIGFNRLVVGKDSLDIQVHGMKLESIKVGKSQYENIPFVFTDLSFLNRNSDFKIDGLLGYEFLKRGIFSINYRKKQFNKWELKPQTYQKSIEEKIPNNLFSKKKKISILFLTKPVDINSTLTSLRFKIIKNSFSAVYKFKPKEEYIKFTFNGK